MTESCWPIGADLQTTYLQNLVGDMHRYGPGISPVTRATFLPSASSEGFTVEYTGPADGPGPRMAIPPELVERADEL